jgi:hypothetical protein
MLQPWLRVFVCWPARDCPHNKVRCGRDRRGIHLGSDGPDDRKSETVSVTVGGTDLRVMLQNNAAIAQIGRLVNGRPNPHGGGAWMLSAGRRQMETERRARYVLVLCRSATSVVRQAAGKP